MRRTVHALAIGMTLAAAALACDAGVAFAQGYRRAPAPPGYVVAESLWGNGTVEGPVRRGRFGWQVRLPRGTWVDCVRSCSETLRLKTVDFWETVGRDAPDGGPNYFSFEFGF